MARTKFGETQQAAIKAAYDTQRIAGKSVRGACEFIARDWKVHWQTIQKVVNSYRPNDLGLEVIKDVKSHQANKIDDIVNSILLDFASSPKLLKGLTPGQVSLTVGTLIDKARLLRGEDVTKIEITEVSDKIVKRMEELKQVREALKKSLMIPECAENN